MEQKNTTSSIGNQPSAQKSPWYSKKLFIIITLITLIILSVVAFILLTRDKVVPARQVEQQLNQSLQTSVGRTDGLKVSFESKSGLATVAQIDKSSHHGLSVESVRTGYVLLVKLGEEMFSNPNVESIKITEKIQNEFPEDPMNEHLPSEARIIRKPIITDVVTIVMTKTNFNSIDWDQYKGQPIDKLITEKAATYIINPELKPQLKDSELYLNLR